MTAVVFWKIAGAVAAFGFGIWIGMGLPGVKKGQPKPGQRATLDRTWMNRLMRGRMATPRRFSTGRLVAPAKRPVPATAGPAEADGDSSGVARVDAQSSEPT